VLRSLLKLLTGFMGKVSKLELSLEETMEDTLQTGTSL
jgi:hypothetical protein